MIRIYLKLIPILIPNINILIPPPKVIYILLTSMFVKNLWKNKQEMINSDYLLEFCELCGRHTGEGRRFYV